MFIFNKLFKEILHGLTTFISQNEVYRITFLNKCHCCLLHSTNVSVTVKNVKDKNCEDGY